MIEPPSSKLQQRLTALNLCGRSDLRRCRSRVRRLARDLPAFDSVWIDALLQNRNITPFQARLLDSPHAEQLVVGPCVLVDQLGRGPHSETYLARPSDGDERCVLKVVRESAGDAARAYERLQSLVAGAAADENAHVVVPHRVVLHEDRPVILSRFVAGQPLTELLVRRGRLPAAVVQEIGRQLIDGLASLESDTLVHGDVTAGNVRLTPSGNAVLVDSGVASAVCPALTMQAGVGPERYDGIAPERIATGNPATAKSDMYALGCLLWQLTAGRPPFSTGDPLSKLAQHQTREIIDVREWAPDTPATLAESITALTAFDAQDRPASFAALAATWGAPRSAGKRRLKNFLAGFRGTAGRILRDGPRSRVLRTAGLFGTVVLFAAVLFGLFDPAVRRRVSELAAPVFEQFATSDASESPQHNTGVSQRRARTGFTSLPAANAEGVILLTSKRPYAWNREIRSQRAVTIRAATGVRPVIVVGNTPARVAAPAVLLEGLRFRSDGTGDHADAMLLVAASRLTVHDCRFDGTPPASPPPKRSDRRRGTAIRLSADSVSGIRLSNVVFANTGDALRCVAAPSTAQFDNVLHLGGGALLKIESSSKRSRLANVTLSRVTQRRAGSLIDVALPGTSIAVTVSDCVFHYSGNDAGLCVLRTSFPGRLPERAIQFSGEGSLIPPGTRVAVEVTGNTTADASKTETVLIDGGLLSGPFEFSGKPGLDPAASTIARHRAPLRSSQPPGIDAARLPRR